VTCDKFNALISARLFTDNTNFYFNDLALKDLTDRLGTLGAPRSFTQTGQTLRVGMTLRNYRVEFAALRSFA
jgi:hypothetical protein